MTREEYEKTFGAARITGHTNPAQLLRYIGRMAEGEKEIWDRMEKALARAGV